MHGDEHKGTRCSARRSRWRWVSCSSALFASLRIAGPSESWRPSASCSSPSRARSTLQPSCVASPSLRPWCEGWRSPSAGSRGCLPPSGCCAPTIARRHCWRSSFAAASASPDCSSHGHSGLGRCLPHRGRRAHRAARSGPLPAHGGLEPSEPQLCRRTDPLCWLRGRVRRTSRAAFEDRRTQRRDRRTRDGSDHARRDVRATGGAEPAALFLIPSGTFGDSPELLRCEQIGRAVEVGQTHWQVGTVELEGRSYEGVTGEATPHCARPAADTYRIAEHRHRRHGLPHLRVNRGRRRASKHGAPNGQRVG